MVKQDFSNIPFAVQLLGPFPRSCVLMHQEWRCGDRALKGKVSMNPWNTCFFLPRGVHIPPLLLPLQHQAALRGVSGRWCGENEVSEFTVGAFWSTWGECFLQGARMLSGSLGCSKKHSCKVHGGEKWGFCSICGLFNILTEDLTNAGWTGGSPCWNIYLFCKYKQMLLRSLAADHQQERAIGALLVYVQSKLARSDLL